MWLLRLRRNLYAGALARELVIELVTRHGYDALKIMDERVCTAGGSRLDRAVNLKAYEILSDMQKLGVPMNCATPDGSPEDKLIIRPCPPDRSKVSRKRARP